ncbi:energy-coupling factor transporter transmembrane component T family protein [Brochothrix campestris]|uniref:Cobalt transport protein n=1 Tax=Brochothrix campestris FSL F6-1037 TaxID=1265861 RepID=W7CTH7_9LIST|nr:energy-coupling factor transporter transmembrane component T [Brochothrix campestris]EUJ39116.1 cobalt transport protein [Brochothrix campestris FSL F6-1037]
MLKIHPLTRIIMLAMAIIMSFVANELLPIIIFSVFLLLYLLIQGFGKTVVYLAVIFGLLYCINAWGEKSDLPESISVFLIFPYFALRLMPIYMAALPLLKQTSPADLLQLFERIRFSRRVSLPVVVCLRYTPTLLNEFTTIRQYVKQRLVGRPFWTKWEYLMVPFLFRSIKISEELAISATLRGIELTNKRTNATALTFRWYDYLFSIGAVIIGVSLEVGL